MNEDQQSGSNIPNVSNNFSKEHASVLLGRNVNITSSFASKRSVAM